MTQPDQVVPGAVTEYDVKRIQAQFRPGSVQPAAHLWGVYARFMRADERPVLHPSALGHALRRAGWQRHRFRRRVAGVQTETASWIVPGARPINEESERMKAVLTDLGGGIWPEDTIWAKYEELAHVNGWRWTDSRTKVMAWLTQQGFIRMRDKRRTCRFVAPERVANL